MNDGSVALGKMKYSKSDLTHLQKDDLVDKFLKLQNHVDHLTSKFHKPIDEELIELRQSLSKTKVQLQESIQRESILVMRLAMKEQEVQELLAQVQETKQAHSRGSTQLRSSLLDPAINLMYLQMQKEIESLKSKLEQAHRDIAALKFTPESQTGKRLVAKCHSLMVENDEIGRMLSSGSISKLEGELALEKQLIIQSKKTEESYEKYMLEMDCELEEMQAAIIEYQLNLKQSQENQKVLSDENHELKLLLKAKTVANDKVIVKKDVIEEVRHDSNHKENHTRHSASTSDSKKRYAEKASATGKLTAIKSSVSSQDAPHTQQRSHISSSGHNKNDPSSASNEKSKKVPYSTNLTDKKTKKHPDDRYDDKSSRTSDKNKQNVCKNEPSDNYKSRKRNFESVAVSEEKIDDRKSKRHHFSSEDHDRTKSNVPDLSNGPKTDGSAHAAAKK